MTETDLTALRRTWHDLAACTPADIARLDPIVGGRPTATEIYVATCAAEDLCAHCPVARICAAEADLHLDEGVRGGSLRYQAGGPKGSYVAVPLTPVAVPSIHDHKAIAARLADKRQLALQAR